MGAQDPIIGPLVDWSKLRQDDFDRLIEALVHYQHPGCEVEVIDGRGGDGGIDVRVIRGDGQVVVYQLKYFPEGFDGRFKDRRRQIRDSLQRALGTCGELAEWVLVAPCKATPSGYVFLEELREAHPGVKITFIDRSKLDGESWVAGHPDVVRALFSHDTLLERARDFGWEQAVLAGGLTDFLKRQDGLNEAVDDLDPHWTYRAHQQPGGAFVSTLVPKHPNAHKASPITFHFGVSPGTAEAEALADAVLYGMLEPLKMSSSSVTHFDLSGPPILTESFETSELIALELHPEAAGQEAQPLILTVSGQRGAGDRGGTGDRIEVHAGIARRVSVGTSGARIRQEFYGSCLVIDWTLPQDLTSRASAGISQNFGKAKGPAQVRSAAALLLRFLEEPIEVRLSSPEDQTLARVAVSPANLEHDQSRHDGEQEDVPDAAIFRLRAQHEAAADLLRIQEHTGLRFPFPSALSPRGRVDLRILRRLLDGEVVRYIDPLTATPTIDPKMFPEGIPPGLLTEARSLVYVTQGPMSWAVEAFDGDERLLSARGASAEDAPLCEVQLNEPMVYYFPKMIAKCDDPASVMARLKRGESVPVPFASPSGQRPRIYLRDRVREGTRVEAVGWGLTGIPELD